ncbi:MAG: HemK/PrmC family methyltransferase, partial [Candidatus Omnitrophota bacterium]
MTETELLFTEVLGCDKASLYLDKSLKLDNDKLSLICSSFKRRIKGEPIQYILGKTEFMGLEFKVAPGVFIPRPETEILVEVAKSFLDFSRDSLRSQSQEVLRILDLCTGSGCIAIALAKLLPYAEIDAVDISKEALKIAEENARTNNVR